ncbi:hypothetical protein JHN59_41945 [Streptomyces sp. MBT49]|uniref:hypothetical protein n=1 Tax=Streptomyces sp. MBT49 TaxID=1488380 RepID=UPI00190AEBAB|nr:hypothetical protein [Streptomyces sp. MBT49]MBK3631226.1 hypothetical protein [Streptomyces sp. MBT49]
MAASTLYGITARRGEELVRCDDATDLPGLGSLVAEYADTFRADPTVRVEVETVSR